MRVGVYFRNPAPAAGGGYTFESTIFHALMRFNTGHEIYVILDKDIPGLAGDPNRRIVLDQPEKKTEVPTRTKVSDDVPDFQNVFNERCLENNIDLVWFITPTSFSVQAPYVITVWDLAHRVMPFFPEVNYRGWTWESREQFYRKALPKAAYIITGTTAGKKEIEIFYAICKERVRVLPFPVPEFVGPDMASPNIKNDIVKRFHIQKPYLYYPANFWPHKNHVGLLHALTTLCDDFKLEFDLVCTGADQGNLSFVRQKAEALGLSGRIHFPGFVSQDEVAYLYKDAFAMVFPTFFGPDNLPPLEAFAMGCPVIASRVQGAEEQLGDAALLFDPKNTREIAACIKQLWDSPSERKRLIANGYNRAKELTAERYVAGIAAIMNEFEAYRRCWTSRELDELT